jgi:hypothetical protein
MFDITESKNLEFRFEMFNAFMALPKVKSAGSGEQLMSNQLCMLDSPKLR